MKSQPHIVLCHPSHLSPDKFAGPELLFDELPPGPADLLSLSQTAGVQRQEDLHSGVRRGSDWDRERNLYQNVFHVKLKQLGHNIPLLAPLRLIDVLVSLRARPFHHVDVLLLSRRLVSGLCWDCGGLK